MVAKDTGNTLKRGKREKGKGEREKGKGKREFIINESPPHPLTPSPPHPLTTNSL
jgi:hypothetical protein